MNCFFISRFLYLVEGGIIKYKLLKGLPKAVICPENLGSTERQLRNGDLMTTYYVTITGFCTSAVVFVTEMFFKLLNIRTFNRSRQTERKRKVANATVKTISNITGYSPPPPYATIFQKSNIGKNNHVRKMINGRDYIVVKEFDGNSRLIPLRTPSAALFQYSYTN